MTIKDYVTIGIACLSFLLSFGNSWFTWYRTKKRIALAIVNGEIRNKADGADIDGVEFIIANNSAVDSFYFRDVRVEQVDRERRENLIGFLVANGLASTPNLPQSSNRLNILPPNGAAFVAYRTSSDLMKILGLRGRMRVRLVCRDAGTQKVIKGKPVWLNAQTGRIEK